MAGNKQQGAVGFAIGILAGMGLKYLWTVNSLPGCGKIAFPTSICTSPKNPTGCGGGGPTYLGWDDVAEIGIGAVIAGLGVRKRNPTVTGVGAGAAVGVVATKLFECQGGYILPIAGFCKP